MKMTKLGITLLLSTLALGTLSLNAQAGVIQVSQESAAGAGDFGANILGTVEVFTTTLSSSDFYRYNSPDRASYNGDLNGGPTARSDETISFFVQASDGLSFVTVHDAPDSTGGHASMTFTLLGDTAAILLLDDNRESSVTGGGTIFNNNHTWVNCCTDGVAFGSLDGNWTLTGGFNANPNGIDDWSVLGTSSEISLALGTRAVQFTSIPVPAPAPLMLFGLALIGLGYRRLTR